MRDGMNLVAKEYVAAQNPFDPGVLILSKFAGAAQQLRDALIVNPYDKFEIAEAIREALFMDQRERVARWERMFATISVYGISWWTGAFLNELGLSMAREHGSGSAPPKRPDRAAAGR